jgi:hypothetical protein
MLLSSASGNIQLSNALCDEHRRNQGPTSSPGARVDINGSPDRQTGYKTLFAPANKHAYHSFGAPRFTLGIKALKLLLHSNYAISAAFTATNGSQFLPKHESSTLTLHSAFGGVKRAFFRSDGGILIFTLNGWNNRATQRVRVLPTAVGYSPLYSPFTRADWSHSTR